MTRSYPPAYLLAFADTFTEQWYNNIQSDDSSSSLHIPVIFPCQLLCLATVISCIASWVEWGGGIVPLALANVLSKCAQLVLDRKQFPNRLYLDVRFLITS